MEPCKTCGKMKLKKLQECHTCNHFKYYGYKINSFRREKATITKPLKNKTLDLWFKKI